MKKILIVDDREEIRDLICMVIRKTYDILQAGNGREAIEMTRKHKPDLILMDIIMPEMNGLEVTRKLKGDPETSQCKIIMLTAMGQKTDYETGIEFGADAYITKPFSPSVLMKTIREILEE